MLSLGLEAQVCRCSPRGQAGVAQWLRVPAALLGYTGLIARTCGSSQPPVPPGPGERAHSGMQAFEQAQRHKH